MQQAQSALLTVRGQLKKHQRVVQLLQQAPGWEADEHIFDDVNVEGLNKQYTFASGVVFEGDYVEGKKRGAGVMTFPDGGKYEGAFDDDCMQGEGVFNYPSGDVYSGAFHGNKKSGVGSYMFKQSQSQFIGEWEDGEFKRGEWILSDGTSWKGEFQGGKPSGDGVQTFEIGRASCRERV